MTPTFLHAQTEWKAIPFEEVTPFFHGQGVSHLLAFRQETASHELEVMKMYTLGSNMGLVYGAEREYVDHLGLHLLERREKFGVVSWEGVWKSRLRLEELPEFRELELVGAFSGENMQVLWWDLLDEQAAGTILLLREAGQPPVEAFLPLSRWDAESYSWVGAGGSIQVRMDESGPVLSPDRGVFLHRGEGQSHVFGGGEMDCIVHENGTVLEFKFTAKTIEFRKCLKGKVGYRVVADGEILLVKMPKKLDEKTLREIALEIAEQESLEEFNLYRERAAFEAAYLRHFDPETYGPVFEAGCLGRWDGGELKPVDQ